MTKEIVLAKGQCNDYQIQKLDGCILYPGESLDLNRDELIQLFKLISEELGVVGMPR